MRQTKIRTKLRPRAVFGIRALQSILVLGAWVIAAPDAPAQPLQSGADVELNNSVPRDVRDVSVEQRLGEKLPLDLPLTDSAGKRLKIGDWIDGQRPTIVTLNYSNCPMLCNVQLNALTESLAELEWRMEEDFRVLTVSIDPHETTSRIADTKRRYLQLLESQVQAEQGWLFATATQPVIDQLTDALGFRYKYDPQTGEYYHPAMLAFVSPDGTITRYSLEVNFPPDQLKLALVEAGQGKVGGAVDQLLLWCYTYDPDRNSYVPQAWKLMRLGGAVTIAGLLVCLFPYWVGRKRSVSADGSYESAGSAKPDAGI